jgi:hypothetical protein
MEIPSTFRLSSGPASIGTRPMHCVSLTLRELHLLWRALNAEAAEAEREGRWQTADTLAWRAAAIREAGR